MATRRMDLENLPSNNREVPNKRPKAKPVISKAARKATKGGLAYEIREIANSLFSSLMKPTMQNLLLDFVNGALRMLVLKEDASSYGRAHTPYNRFFDTSPTYQKSSSYSTVAPPIRANPYEPVLIPTRQEAETVLYHMRARIEEFGWVTVGDLYSMCRMPSNFTQERWGWTDLKHVGIGHTNQGWFIDLPEPVHR